MEVKQIYSLVNDVTKEVLGESPILNEDLSNVVDIGTAIFDNRAFDNYVRSLVDHIGKVVFVLRSYKGRAPSVLMDGWTYGSILEKISADMPEAVETEDWELTDKVSYDPNIFHKPKVSAKFFNSRTTFEVDASITEMQVREAFSSAGQLNSFISMIFNEIDKSMTVKTDALVMRTINNFIGETLNDNNNARAVNLLSMYNTEFGTTLTADKAIKTPEFIRYASYIMGIYVDRLSTMSKLFNIEGKARFTPNDMLHFVTLSDFSRAADVYLQSDVYHNELTRIPSSETVSYWQGSGEAYDFNDISAINIKTASGATVNKSGILAVMFDRDALGVNCFDKRVRTNYNAKAEFTNYFYKQDAQYFNDFSENFVVFYIA